MHKIQYLDRTWVKLKNYENIFVYSNPFFAFYLNYKTKKFDYAPINELDIRLPSYSIMVENDYTDLLNKLNFYV